MTRRHLVKRDSDRRPYIFEHKLVSMKDAVIAQLRIEPAARNLIKGQSQSLKTGTMIATFIYREEKKMLAIITLLIFAAAILAVTLGISFLAVEMTLRIIGRGLRLQSMASDAIRRPINRHAVYQNQTGERSEKTRLQAITAHLS